MSQNIQTSKSFPVVNKRKREVDDDGESLAGNNALDDGSSGRGDDDDATGNAVNPTPQHDKMPATEHAIANTERDGKIGDDEYSDGGMHPASNKTITSSKTSKAKGKDKAATTTAAVKTTIKSSAIGNKKTQKPKKQRASNKAWIVSDIVGVRQAQDWEADAPSYQVLVKWEGFEQSDPTWYNIRTLRNDRLVLELLLDKILKLAHGGTMGGHVSSAVPGLILHGRQEDDEDEGAAFLG